MLCPHCLKEVHFSDHSAGPDAPPSNVLIVPEFRGGDPYYHVFRSAFCPACRKIILMHSDIGLYMNKEFYLNLDVNDSGELVFWLRRGWEDFQKERLDITAGRQTLPEA